MDLTNEDVAEILALLDSLPYDEFDLRTPRFRLTLRRAPGGGWTEESRLLAEPAAATSAPTGSPARPVDPSVSRPADSAASWHKSGISDMSGAADSGGTDSAGADSAGADSAGADSAGAHSAEAISAGADSARADRAGMAPVTAPLPGTFYRAPRPGAAPFVEVGDDVAEDTVVAIVETMKLMNSVHAGKQGRVAEICLENAELAAQGATLMWIEPAT